MKAWPHTQLQAQAQHRRHTAAQPAMDKALLKAHCLVCGNPEARRRCGECGVPHYCGVECQRKDWPRHKKECKRYIEDGRQDLHARGKARLAA